MASLLARALSVVAPPFCWACGAEARSGDPLCRSCRLQLRWLAEEPETIAVGSPAAAGGGGVLGAPLSVWAPLAYEGPARAVVRGFKYRGAAGLAEPMAAAIAAAAPPGLLVPPRVLVPVPLHPARRRRRGFNQAERLAAGLARRTGLELSDCLRRGGRPGVGQVGRGREQRLAAIGGSIGLRGDRSAPAAAVLVDDVATTGATLAACARALRAGGAREVSAVVYARTPGR